MKRKARPTLARVVPGRVDQWRLSAGPSEMKEGFLSKE